MTIPPDDPADLIRRAFVGSPTDFRAWSQLKRWLRPVTDQIADSDVERRMGKVASDADRAEARDIVWRAVLGEKGAGLRAWDGRGSLPDHVEDRARASARLDLRVMDLRLVQRWQGGHARAGNQLELRLRAVIYARAKRVLLPAGWGRDAIAEGACEAWVKVVPALLRWRPDGGTSLENWVGQSVERAAISMIRDANAAKRQGQEVSWDDAGPSHECPDPGMTPEEAARWERFVSRIAVAMVDGLSQKERDVITDDQRGLSLDEICRRHDATRNFVYKARAKFKQLVWRLLDPDPPA